MQIELNGKLLIDSAYNASNSDDKELFIFDDSKVHHIINDIRKLRPSCFLVTGYRGVGKSSFIKKVESEIADDNIIFIHSSFANYKGMTNFLRRLIRALHGKIKNSKKYEKDLEENKSKNVDSKKIWFNELDTRLEILNKRTFQNIDESETVRTVWEKFWKTEFKLNGLNILIVFGPIFLVLLAALNSWINLVPISDKLSLVIASLTNLTKPLQVAFSYSKKRQNIKETKSTTIYDDEIAETLFSKLLQDFKSFGYKIVFVLDELDKVAKDEINQLIVEMKPFFISGLAYFVAVTGQDLYYKYLNEEIDDDQILSSLFSKIIHIPLPSLPEFERILNVVRKKENSDVPIGLLQYLVYQSNYNPRRFISLLRQKLIWQNDVPYLFIEESKAKLDEITSIINVIEEIDKTDIQSDGFVDGKRDYFKMALILKAKSIIDGPKG